MIDYIQYKVWDAPLKCGNGLVVSSHTSSGIWVLIYAGI